MTGSLLKKLFALSIAVIMIFLTSSPAIAQELQLDAASAVLIDADSGRVLFEKNAHERRAPASVTKVMTLLIILEAIEKGRAKLTDEVITSENAASMGGSQVYLEPGEKFTLEKMLIGIAVGSANDACVAVAEHLYGSEAGFVKKMNEKVKELGLKNTHFSNVHGLPAENHYTSAYDMAMISRYAYQNYPMLLKLTSIYEYEFRPQPKPLILYNTNKMLRWYEGTDGFKTGWTNEAGYCLSSTVKRGDMRLIAVVMGCPVPKSHFRESIKLHNWGFANFMAQIIIKKGKTVKKVKVLQGEQETVDIIAERTLSPVVEKNGSIEDKGIEVRVKAPDEIKAPVKKGDKLGVLIAIKDGKEIGRVNLVAKETVQKGNLFKMIKRTIVKMFNFSK